MDLGITSAWARETTGKSQSEVYDQVRNDLINAAANLANTYGVNGVTGNMIDSYHDNAFDDAGIGSGFYGGNLWPQGVFPNPVPFDEANKSGYDPRHMLPKDDCSCSN